MPLETIAIKDELKAEDTSFLPYDVLCVKCVADLIERLEERRDRLEKHENMILAFSENKNTNHDDRPTSATTKSTICQQEFESRLLVCIMVIVWILQCHCLFRMFDNYTKRTKPLNGK